MYSVFERLLKEKNLKISDVVRATGIAPSTISEWKKGLYTPKHDKLCAIASFLNVSVEYLTTGSEIDIFMDSKISDHPCLHDLAFMDYVMKLWNLPPERKDPILRQIRLETADYREEVRKKDGSLHA